MSIGKDLFKYSHKYEEYLLTVGFSLYKCNGLGDQTTALISVI